MGVTGLVVGLGVLVVIAAMLRRRWTAAGEVAGKAAAAQEVAVLQEQARRAGLDLAGERERRAALEGEVTQERERLVGLTSDLARAQASLAGGEERRRELVAELQAARDDGAKVQAVAGEAQARASQLGADLARLQAALDAERARAAGAARDVEVLRGQVDDLRGQVVRAGEERARLATALDAERKAAAERREEEARNREQVRAEIQTVASRLLEQQGRAMLERNREGMQALLQPMAGRLQEFQARIERVYDAENRDRATLLKSMEALNDTQARLHKDAEALSKALTGDSKKQGDWGELVLERVLETAGLTEGREYDLQVNHVDDEGGRKRPDALVYLPGNRAVVVDAKCSLTAYVEAQRALDDGARDLALDAHVASVRGHVRELVGKNYTAVLAQRTLDLVLMFVPNEAAFLAALGRSPSLYEEAFRQGVVLCSPTTLLAALQLVAHVWRSERSNVNAQQIAEEAGKLLEKLAGFVEDLDDVGVRLAQAQDAHEKARKKLGEGRGNVLGRAKVIARLGARVNAEKVRGLLGDGDGDEDGPQLALGAPKAEAKA